MTHTKFIPKSAQVSNGYGISPLLMPKSPYLNMEASGKDPDFEDYFPLLYKSLTKVMDFKTAEKEGYIDTEVIGWTSHKKFEFDAENKVVYMLVGKYELDGITKEELEEKVNYAWKNSISTDFSGYYRRID